MLEVGRFFCPRVGFAGAIVLSISKKTIFHPSSDQDAEQGSWSTLNPSGTAPSARGAHVAVAATGVNGFYIFGGSTSANGESQLLRVHALKPRADTCSCRSSERPAPLHRGGGRGKAH